MCLHEARRPNYVHVYTRLKKPDSDGALEFNISLSSVYRTINFVYHVKCMSYDIDTTEQPQQCRNFNADLRRMHGTNLFLDCFFFENSAATQTTNPMQSIHIIEARIQIDITSYIVLGACCHVNERYLKRKNIQNGKMDSSSFERKIYAPFNTW